MPTPVGIEVDLGVILNQLAFSKRGAIDPAVYPNLGLASSFWTPRCVQPGRHLTGPGRGTSYLSRFPRGHLDTYPLTLSNPVLMVCRSGQQALSQNGNMYISGTISLSVGLVGNPIGIELTGTGTQLISWTGGVGYSITVTAAPSSVLLGGAISINLASLAQAPSSLYFKYVDANDFTVALQATLTLNPGDFLGALPAAPLGSANPEPPALLVALAGGLLCPACVQGLGYAQGPPAGCELPT